MKIWLSFCLTAFVLGGVAVQGQSAPQDLAAQAQPADLTYSANEVIKLHQSGIGDEVIKSFIANSNTRFQLSASDIVYMHQLGLTSPLITGMITRDQQLRESAPPYVAPAAQPAPAATAQQPDVVSQPAPTVVAQPPVSYTYPSPVYAYPSYPYYYGSPYYGAPYYYGGPSFSFGIGVGPWFGGHGGFHGHGDFHGHGGGGHHH